MNPEDLIRNLEKNGESILSLFVRISESEALWKPAPEKWSLIEILNHLCDEEREDFRKRLSLVLENPEQDWPPIDPQGWAREHDYQSRNLEKTLMDFKKERTKSLKWLRSLDSPEWTNEHRHPQIGGLKAGDLLASWAAHDLFHIRQIANTLFSYFSENAQPFSTQYVNP